MIAGMNQSFKRDSLFVPAGPSYWRCHRSEWDLHKRCNIHLKPKLIEQVAEAPKLIQSGSPSHELSGSARFALHQIAMLLLAELQSGGIMGDYMSNH